MKNIIEEMIDEVPKRFLLLEVVNVGLGPELREVTKTGEDFFRDRNAARRVTIEAVR